jgi:hypothetical protein
VIMDIRIEPVDDETRHRLCFWAWNLGSDEELPSIFKGNLGRLCCKLVVSRFVARGEQAAIKVVYHGSEGGSKPFMTMMIDLHKMG